jgi:UDP-glucose 4-epimerase
MRMAATENHKARTIDVVTGATSSLGLHLIRELLKRGDEVRVIVKDNPKEGEDWKTLPAGCVPYIADLTLKEKADKDVLMVACNRADNIFHFAAATYNYKFKYSQMVDINVIGTENLIRAYLDANPDKESIVHLIYTSSVTVYGYQRQEEQLTEESDTKPASGYSETKLMAEKVIESFASADKRITYTILRLGTIYGQGYEHEFFKIFRLLRDRNVRYIGKATNHLTLVAVDDAVDALMLASSNSKSMNKIYNITDGVPYTQKDLFNKAAQFLNTEPPSRGVHPLIARIGAKINGLNYDEFEFLISDRIVSIDRAKKELGFKPSCSIDVEGREMAKNFTRIHNKQH